MQGDNILNLPYSDSEEENEQEVDLTKKVASEHEEFPSPTPREGQGEPMEKVSYSKPRSQRINQLLGKAYELEVLEREIKSTNATLTKRNTELHDSLLEMRGMYILLQKRNLRLMKDNSMLYKIIRLSRLQKKNSNLNSQDHLALETLVEEQIIIQDLEVAHNDADIPNLIQVEEVPQGQK